MKKTLSILALGAFVLFTGCKDDDPDPTVNVIVENPNVAYNQATVAATVQTTGTWLASSNASWCILPEEWKYGGRDDATINFEVLVNKYLTSRSALISFTSTLNGRFMKAEVIQEALPATADIIPFIDDATFKSFCVDEFATNGVLTYGQSSAITSLDVSGQSISNLSWGLEYFTGLTSLNCSDTNVTMLDISTLTRITTLIANPSKVKTIKVWESFDTENLPAGFNVPDNVTFTK